MAAPFVVASYRSLDPRNASRQRRLLIAASTGFLFALTALKFPSVAGSSSHPTGVALGAVLLGARAMPMLTVLVLLFQALLLAHCGLTTIGANVFSLGIVGPAVVAGVWRLSAGSRLSPESRLIAATVISSLATYVTTAFQLAIAFPDPAGGVLASSARFLSIFVPVQVQVAIIESLVAVAVWRAVKVETRSLEVAS